jgi:hypothetical protein
MLFYVIFSILILISIVFLLIQAWLWKKKRISIKLFAEALRDENSGDFEAAVITYKSALREVKKTRFHNNLENKIVAKLKVLHTNIEYNKSILFTRPYRKNSPLHETTSEQNRD